MRIYRGWQVTLAMLGRSKAMTVVFSVMTLTLALIIYAGNAVALGIAASFLHFNTSFILLTLFSGTAVLLSLFLKQPEEQTVPKPSTNVDGPVTGL